MNLPALLNNANAFVGLVIEEEQKKTRGKSQRVSERLYPIGNRGMARDIKGFSYSAKLVGKKGNLIRVYNRHPEGCHAMERMYREAIASGAKRQFLFESEYLDILKKVQHELLEVRTFDELFVGDLPGEVMSAEQMLRFCRSEPLKESQTHVVRSLRFYDSKGQKNLGMLRCRWGELKPKLDQYSYSIDGWTSHYLDHQSQLRAMRFEFMSQLKKLKKAVAGGLTDAEFDFNHWYNLKPYREFVIAFDQLLGKGGREEQHHLIRIKELQMQLIGLDIFLSDKELVKNEVGNGYGYPVAEFEKMRKAFKKILDNLYLLNQNPLIPQMPYKDPLKGQLWKHFMSQTKGWERGKVFFRRNIFTHTIQHQRLRDLLGDMIEMIGQTKFPAE